MRVTGLLESLHKPYGRMSARNVRPSAVAVLGFRACLPKRRNRGARISWSRVGGACPRLRPDGGPVVTCGVEALGRFQPSRPQAANPIRQPERPTLRIVKSKTLLAEARIG